MIYEYFQSKSAIFEEMLQTFSHFRGMGVTTNEMKMKQIMNTIGHYAKKAAKAVTKPVNLFIAGVALTSLLSFQEVQAQYNPEGDTIYASGIFSAYNVDNNFAVSDAVLTLRPLSMAMTTPDTTYTFITDGNGLAEFDNLPVYIDSTTGIKDLLNQKTQVLPTFGSEMNAFFPSIQKGTIEVYNMSGQLVQKQEFNIDHEYLQFNNMAAGMYIYNIRTEDGIELGGKFLKQNVPLKGPASRPLRNTSSTHKNAELYDAQYWLKWEHPDYYTDSTIITLEDGDNGFIGVPMTSNITPIPQYQWLTGIAQKSKTEGYGPLANMTAVLYNQTLNETTQVTTDANGEFVFPEVPVGSVCFISVGGNEGRYAINNIEYTVPNVIESMDDTLANYFSTINTSVQNVLKKRQC